VFPGILNKIISDHPITSTTKINLIDYDKTGMERIRIWDKTYYMINNHPVLGVGDGNWQIFFPDANLYGLWRVEDLNVTFQRPHNDFLWILSETGYVGFNIFLLFITCLLLFQFKTTALQSKTRDYYIDSLFLAFIAGYFVIAFFDFPKERIEHNLWMNITFGFSYFHIKRQGQIRGLLNVPLSRKLMLIPVLLLSFIVTVGFLRFKGEYNTKKMYVMKQTNKFENVVVSCDNALSFAYSIDPTSIPIHWYRGNANASLRKFDLALKDFIDAWRMHPYNRNVLNDLASAYVMKDDIESGKKYYKEAARISPRFDEPKLNLAALLINEGKYYEADFWLKSLYHDSERRTAYQEIIDQKSLILPGMISAR
jgi:tetratricopeptide (TPR) repeat protein